MLFRLTRPYLFAANLLPVTLLALSLTFLQSTALASSVEQANCQATAPMSSNDVLTQVYDSVQYLGIAVPDHLRLAPFDKLAEFLRIRGLDPALKTIAVEDSADIQDLYEKASVEEIDYAHFENLAREKYLGINTQTKYVVDHLLPVLREINKQRAGDPVLMVPIDSVNTAAAFEIFSVAPPAPIRAIPRSLSTAGIEQRFFGSIERERKTAANFKRLISDRFPDRKGIVIYHGAHIFKNLSAVGADRVGGELIAKRTVLPWMSLARMMVPTLARSYKVVATDYDLGLVVPMSYVIPQGLRACLVAGQSSGFIWPAIVGKKDDLFTSKSFFNSYRAGTIKIMNPNKPVFDAIIVDR